MRKWGELAARLALPVSIVFSTGVFAVTSRYEVHNHGTSVLVHDRWLGTVEWCHGGGDQSRCRSVLASGMAAIDKPPARPSRMKPSDDEFKRMMDDLFPAPAVGME